MPGLRLRGAVLAADPTAGPVDVVVEDGVVAAVAHPPGAEHAGLLLAPGFVDLQCNGGIGIDLASSPERLWELAADLPRTGVTSFLPTLVSSPDEALDGLRAAMATGGRGARPLGVHLEGPYLARPGAHRPEQLRYPGGSLEGVLVMTVAPELLGALELLTRLDEAGVVPAIGHTDASTAVALAAVDAGARFVTHLFNAMAPLHHREPGVAGLALADDRLAAGVVVDGVHVHPVAVAAAWRALGPDRFVLVTDATAARGAPPGPLRLGETWADYDGTAVRTADGRLAGSALSMDQAVRNLVAFTGCSPIEAVASATVAPAAVLGRRAEVVVGAEADLVLLDEQLRVAATIVAGDVAYDRDGRFTA